MYLCCYMTSNYFDYRAQVVWSNLWNFFCMYREAWKLGPHSLQEQQHIEVRPDTSRG